MPKSDQPSTQGKPTSSPGKLVETGKKDSIKLTELTDDELKKVSGGHLTLGGATSDSGSGVHC